MLIIQEEGKDGEKNRKNKREERMLVVSAVREGDGEGELRGRERKKMKETLRRRGRKLKADYLVSESLLSLIWEGGARGGSLFLVL